MRFHAATRLGNFPVVVNLTGNVSISYGKRRIDITRQALLLSIQKASPVNHYTKVLPGFTNDINRRKGGKTRWKGALRGKMGKQNPQFGEGLRD